MWIDLLLHYITSESIKEKDSVALLRIVPILHIVSNSNIINQLMMAVESIKNWGDFNITDIMEGIT